MSQSSVIVCKPTQWIKIRAVLIILMFAVFMYLFYNDGTVGYREKNEHRLFYELFTEVAKNDLDKVETESEWRAHVAAQTVKTPNAEDCPLPLDFDYDQKWPVIIADSFEEMNTGVNGPKGVWETYAGGKEWDAKPADKYFDQGKLTEQFVMAYICLGLVIFVSALFIRTLLRTMEVTEEAYIAPGGKVIPFASMTRIDARKWDTKGVALIEYEVDGSTKKAKIDGMIYGQFKQEDGQPAERLYEFVLERFKGEIIEFETVEDEVESSDENSTEAESKNSEAEANS